MNYQVFIQNPAEKKFMASVVGLPNVTANGVTEREAIDKLKVILNSQFKNGKLVTICIPQLEENNVDLSTEENDPWITNMGIFENDPTFDDFLAEINTYHNEVDATRDIP